MKYLKTVFSLDLRSLALFRILISVVILLDLWVRGQYLTAHYTDFGVLPRSLETKFFTAEWYFSFHNSFGSIQGQVALFIIQAICALCLLVGFRTRLFNFISWFLIISLQNRNYLVLNAGDVYFRLVLFWGMFLPLGARYSLDASLKKEPEGEELPQSFFSIGSIAFVLQLVMVYFFSGLLKECEPNWRDGVAVFFALNTDTYATAFGKWVGTHRGLLFFLNPIVLWLEITFGFLVFASKRNSAFRWAAILMVWGFHISIFFMFEVGFLSTVGVIAWMALIPSSTWDFIDSKLTRFRGNGIQIQYDQDCSICLKILKVLIPGLGLTKATLIPAPLENSWIVTDPAGKRHIEFDALCVVFENSFHGRLFAPLMRFKPVFAAGTGFYQWFAGHREMVAPIVPDWNRRATFYGDSKISQTVAGAALIAVILFNISTLPLKPEFKLPETMNSIMYFLRIEQNWSMFRQPVIEDGWWVIPGTLKNGKKIDLYRNGAPYTAEKPPSVSKLAPTDRWRKYHTSLYDNKNDEYFLAYGRYRCWLWNTTHTGDEQLLTFQFIFMREDNVLNGERPPVKEVLFWTHKCFD